MSRDALSLVVTALGVAATTAMPGAAVIVSSHGYSDLLLPGPITLDPAHQLTSGPFVNDPGGKPPLAKAFEQRCL
jgi:hypothetical protein